MYVSIEKSFQCQNEPKYFSPKVTHKVLYAAKTNTDGTAVCQAQDPCSNNGDQFIKKTTETVFLNYELPPKLFNQNSENSKHLKDIYPICESTPEKPTFVFNTRTLNTGNSEKLSASMEYIDMFIAKDEKMVAKY